MFQALRKSFWLAGAALALAGSPALAAPASDFVAHEWGTFTSLEGSNGKTIEGLQHEEEGLPDFVYSRNRLAPAASVAFQPMLSALSDPSPQPTPRPHPRPCTHCKGFENAGALAGVTQKLETPVIYFYSARPRHVNVNVEFPRGVISQWYPNALSFRPDIGEGTTLAGGAMSWSVDLTNDPLALPFVPKASIWSPSRHVRSAFVKVGSENERFIFYRGLGRFDVPFEMVSTSDGGLAAINHSEQPIAGAFLLHVEKNGGAVQALGAVPAHGSVSVAGVQPASQPLDEYVAQAKMLLKQALVASGLYDDEAQAMVDTWSRSYFKTPGVRVLYIVPREWTDRLLPLAISPEPRDLVRTLVGRVEVFTAADERTLVSALERAAHGGPAVDLAPYGRFAEPKLRRALELSSDPAALALGETLLKTL